jgi:hypothetical protein
MALERLYQQIASKCVQWIKDQSLLVQSTLAMIRIYGRGDIGSRVLRENSHKTVESTDCFKSSKRLIRHWTCGIAWTLRHIQRGTARGICRQVLAHLLNVPSRVAQRHHEHHNSAI